MNFMEFAAYEREALKPSAWEKWCAKVEKIIGHDLDGNQESDGYSLDFALEEFERGLSPQQYAASIKRPEPTRWSSEMIGGTE